jgi:filamentous hemagglutinin family protein
MNNLYFVLRNALVTRICNAMTGSAPAARHPLTALVALISMAWSAPGWATRPALPQGVNVVSGAVTLALDGTHMTIRQTSDKSIINWQSFDIGKDRQVTFQQPSAASVALNRVVGTGAYSNISGTLNANGQVFLVNPNGVLFGSSSRVDVGGLVASALDLRDDDFQAGRYHFRNPRALGPAGPVSNKGHINVADGGAVALLGGEVGNHGQVHARLGLIALATGNQITLDFTGDQSLQVIVNEPTFGARIINSGQLQADGGNVWMTAGATDALLQTVINNTGHIRARTVVQHHSKIRLSATTTEVTGTLDASAASGDAGDIEISATHVQIQRGARMLMGSTDASGRTGRLAIRASNLRVEAQGNADSHIDADTLSDALDTGDVTLHSVTGDLHVDAPVHWKRNTLTLTTPGSVHVDSIMTASGSAALDINHGEMPPAQAPTPAHGLNMGLSAEGFTGRVDFTDVVNQSKPANRRLKINGRSYILLTAMGSPGSQTTQDLQGIEGGLRNHYALAQDLDAGDFGPFRPLGSTVLPFMGRFDGLGHQIANLQVDAGQDSRAGLFGQSAGDLRNLGLKDANVKSHSNRRAIAAGLVAELWKTGSISNVHASATVQADAQGTNARAIAASVVGVMKGGVVNNAYAKGKVTATVAADGSAALPAHLVAGSALLSGIDVGAYAVAAGIAGHLEHEGRIVNAHSTAEVTGSALLTSIRSPAPAKAFIGGAIGVNAGGSHQNVSADGAVSSDSFGSTVISMHGLVGNAANALRGTFDELRQHPALARVPGTTADSAPALAPGQ